MGMGGNSGEYRLWASVEHNELPSISNLHLTNDTGLSGDGMTTDATVAGQIAHVDGSVAGLPVEYDYTGDGLADGVTYSDYSENGLFVIDLNGWLLPPQTVSLSVRAGEWDNSNYNYVFGAWANLAFTFVEYQNVAPLAAADQFVVETNSTAVWLNVIRNDHDPDGSPLNLVGTGTATHGQVSIAIDGQGILYTPEVGYPCHSAVQNQPLDRQI